jgi:hypothetical protein
LNKEKILCKTWYVTQAMDVKASGKQRNHTEEAKGSEFIFKQDHSFDFIMKSRNRNRAGAWKFVASDSLRIELSKVEITFYIQHFSNDSMQLIGKEGQYKTMYISFSSSYVTPFEKKTYTSDEKYLETDNTTPLKVESIEIDESKEPLIKEKISKLICKTWHLKNATLTDGEEIEEIDETEEIVFLFKKDQTFTFIEENETEESGKWEVLDDLTLNLEIDKEIINFKIIKITEDTLKSSGE